MSINIEQCGATCPDACKGDQILWNQTCQKATASPEHPCTASTGNLIPGADAQETETQSTKIQVNPLTYSLQPRNPAY